MAMYTSAAWNNQDPTLAGPSQDDFQQFLDMGLNNLGDSLQLDFQDFDGQQGRGSQLLHQDEAGAMDVRMENGRRPLGQDTAMQDQMSAITTAAMHPAIHGPPIVQARNSSESLVELDAQIEYLQHQRNQQRQRQIQEQQRNYFVQNRLMPTPNSGEVHGVPQQFYSQSDPQHQAMYERYQMQMKEQEIAFTPLVSPAVTPLEAHFNIPEYTVPGAYFSPLSSPALHAQNEHPSIYDQVNSNTTNSPVEMNLDSHSAPPSSVILASKPSRKPQQKSRSIRGIRQSPIVKPRKAKKSSSSTITAQALGDIMEPPNTQLPSSKATNSSHSAGSTENSDNGSISPEHLSDMAPPPVPQPGSIRKSPYIVAQKDSRSVKRLSLGSPATPASLMRLTQSPNGNQATINTDMDVDESTESFSLPEAANPSGSMPARINTRSDGQVTPTLASTGAKTPGFQPLPPPAFARPNAAASASQSPQIDAMNGVSGTSRRTPVIASRASKKRSNSSVLVSPALLPRISPSIKPLLPGGGTVSEDTASLLLASKSNYQNILEGTHLPGVSYPTELSTNLTSKRTSHKIAEQGRRNRINSALQEIATLLPPGPGKDCCGDKSGSGDGGENNENGNTKGGAQSANSKASTVELAIEYIKQLKKELADANKRAEEAEKQLETKT